jgi:DnaK suppressor protein
MYDAGKMNKLSIQQLAELKNDLLTLDRDLNELLNNTNASAQPVDLHDPIGRLTRVDAMHQQGILVANRTLAANRLRHIALALGRLADRSYGDCLGCGEIIAYARLKAYPETPYCLVCQSKNEAIE